MKIPKIFDHDNFTDKPEILEACYLDEWAWAQKLFENWLKENSKVVYGIGNCWMQRDDKLSDDTHQGLLICIEPIKQCKHKEVWQHRYSKELACRDCGKPLKIKFEVNE